MNGCQLRFRQKQLNRKKNKDDNIYNAKPPTDTGHFHSSNRYNWLPYPILGCKNVKNVQIDPQTTEILSKKLNICE